MRLHFTLVEKIIGGTAAVLFWSFLASCLWLGGDALNGKVVDGHYMLGNHGRYTEVSRAVFIYSYVHAISMLLSFAVAIWTAWRAAVRNKW